MGCCVAKPQELLIPSVPPEFKDEMQEQIDRCVRRSSMVEDESDADLEQLVTQLKRSANNSAVERECVADITKARLHVHHEKLTFEGRARSRSQSVVVRTARRASIVQMQEAHVAAGGDESTFKEKLHRQRSGSLPSLDSQLTRRFSVRLLPGAEGAGEAWRPTQPASRPTPTSRSPSWFRV